MKETKAEKIKQRIEERLAQCEEAFEKMEEDNQYKDMAFGELHSLRCIVSLIEELEKDEDC